MASTWVLSIKLLLISTGLLSISMLIKLTIPLATQFICYQIPIIWSCAMSLLRPPYLYFVINVIIIIIAATSRCHDKGEETERSDPLVSRPNEVLVYDDVSHEVAKRVVVASDDVAERKDDEVAVLRSTWTPPQRSKSLERLPEKPMVSTKAVEGPKNSPRGGKSFRSKHNDTLENTWKTIADARPINSVNKMRHIGESRQNATNLTKCDTSANKDINSVNANPLAVKKSATFRDRTNYDPTVNSSPSKFQKEPSLSQDELNSRVEAFIRKFQDEMRLQRQESLNHYMDMIKRGGH